MQTGAIDTIQLGHLLIFYIAILHQLQSVNLRELIEEATIIGG